MTSGTECIHLSSAKAPVYIPQIFFAAGKLQAKMALHYKCPWSNCVSTQVLFILFKCVNFKPCSS